MEQGFQSPREGPSASAPSPWLFLPPAVEADSGARARCGTIYAQYRLRVLGFLARRGFPPDERQELTQEVFLRVFREGGRFETRGQFEGWLFTIAVNLYCNAVRDQHAAKRSGEEESLEHLLGWKGNPGRLERQAREATSTRPEQLEGALREERRERLREAVAELPPRMRRCLWLRVFQGHSYDEIARLLRIRVFTVKAHLRQARLQLRKRLGPEFQNLDF